MGLFLIAHLVLLFLDASNILSWFSYLIILIFWHPIFHFKEMSYLKTKSSNLMLDAGTIDNKADHSKWANPDSINKNSEFGD